MNPALGNSLLSQRPRRSGVRPVVIPPVLSADVEYGSYEVFLAWTASPRATLYKIYGRLNGGSTIQLEETPGLFFLLDLTSDAGAWEFWVIPENSAGEGPSSNTVGKTLPGESEPGFRFLLNSG
ncbi:MAG TPA: hypothetical protein VGE29_15750, partial [Prosthecobacter sp.]